VPKPGHDPNGRRAIWNELDQSSVMSVELIAAILTWGGIGWLVDRWLGTLPVFFGIGTIVGFAAGLYLVWYRSGKHQDYPDGARTRPAHEHEEGR
jgi:F0F1-type ATP synthase assembly protein I